MQTGAQGSPPGGGFLTRLRREKPLAVVLGIVLLLLIGVALFADVLAPFGPNEVFLMDRLQGSSARYPLGTDQLGRDFMSRLIYGARLTLGVGLAATAVNVLVALVVGGVSGFVGGRLDLTVQRFVDAWMSIPGLLILLTVMSVVGRGVLQIIVVLGVLGGIGGSRVVRGAVIGAKETGLLRGGAGGRQLALAHPAAPPAAQGRQMMDHGDHGHNSWYHRQRHGGDSDLDVQGDLSRRSGSRGEDARSGARDAIWQAGRADRPAARRCAGRRVAGLHAGPQDNRR